MTDSQVHYADCLIIGGGPAGAACGIALKNFLNDSSAQDRETTKANGRRVVIVERDVFPRFKVCGCCFNGSGESILKALGCHSILSENNAVPLDRWHAQFSGNAVKATLPTGWAISRETLDAALLEHAKSIGVEVLQPANAKLLDANHQEARFEIQDSQGTKTQWRAPVAVVATGLAGLATDKWLPWSQSPGGPIGAGAVFQTASDCYETGVIYMACSKTGYAGIVRLPGNWIDVAAALYDPSGRQRGLSLGERITNILKDAGMPILPELLSDSNEPSCCATIVWKGTPLLHRQRQVANRSLLAVGDAAGYVEPFTGEGMAWALRTAKLAADCIAQKLWSPGGKPAAASLAYQKLYKSEMQSRKLPCRLLSSSLRHDLGRRIVFSSLHYFPWLAQPFIRTINSA